MLRLPPFTLRTPTTLAEAASILAAEGAAEGKARPVAGGTDLWPNMKRRHQVADTVVSLMRIPDLAAIHANGQRSTTDVRLGATALLADVAADPHVRGRYPALATAVEAISSPPLRQMGTLGGNVCVDTRCTYYNQTEEWRRSIDFCMKAEGEICWVAPSSPRCWAHSASDSAPMLAALEARVRLVGPEGERTVPIEALYRDDGIDYLAKRPDELVAEVLLPAESAAERCRSSFRKLRRRGSIDFAVLSVGAAIWLDGDEIAEATITKARVFLGAVASYPAAAEKTAAALVGRKLDAETIADAAAVARKNATPMDNTDFQAQWRGAVVGKYVEAALADCAGLPSGRLV
ncbi:MAG TPA: FAD binding domain-containing protein [Thermoanaerobaculia bacterium]|nr:FAD binding domain-containing protein [Thermoanaerobaculia bacterium]